MPGILMGILGKKLSPPASEPDGDEALDFEGGLADAMEDLAEALAKVRELGFKPEDERTEVDDAAMKAACRVAARAFENAFKVCGSKPNQSADDDAEE